MIGRTEMNKIYDIPAVADGKPVYIAFSGEETNNGATEWTAKKSPSALPAVMPKGGTAVVCGKAFSAESCELCFAAPVRFTAIAPDGTDYREYMPEHGALMWTGGCTLTLSSDVLFEHINIYSRSVKANILRISNGATVVFDDVSFRVQNSAHQKTALHIDKGATAVMLGDKPGHLSSVKGEGRLVIDRCLVEYGRITRVMTENFAGEICGLDGEPIEFPPESGRERLHPSDVYSYGSYTANDGTVIPYRYYLPEGYDPEKKYPIVVYMHGNGSRGTDNERHLRSDGAALHNRIFRSNYDCIIFAPQCTDASMWCDIRSAAGSAGFFDREMGVELRAMAELYDKFVSEHSVDLDRQYYVGMSCGGAAAWELMYHYPSKFTAVIPIAGALQWDGVLRYAERAVGDTAVWTFHGSVDRTCNVNATRALYAALSAAGRNIRYTEVKGDSHGNIWIDAAEENGVIEWLFSQRKKIN